MTNRQDSVRPSLDMGAGRGEIAEIIASASGRVEAVDPDAHMVSELRRLSRRQPRVIAVRDSLQTFSTESRYDLVVLAYVLESIDGHDVPRHVERLLGLLRPGGRVVGVTYLDGCDWDAYSSAVEHVVPYGRTGGTGKVFGRLRRAGLNARILRILDTHISDSTVEALYLTLGFFYKRKLEAYLAHRDTLSVELERYATPRGAGVCLEVKEAVYEILPMAS